MEVELKIFIFYFISWSPLSLTQLSKTSSESSNLYKNISSSFHGRLFFVTIWCNICIKLFKVGMSVMSTKGRKTNASASLCHQQTFVNSINSDYPI